MRRWKWRENLCFERVKNVTDSSVNKCDPLNLDLSGISSKVFGKRFHSFDDRHRDGTIHHIIPFI